jgi:predicted DNA-binding transcriptional regulator AlpA
MLTTRDLASMLAISPKTIYSYVERNLIPQYKIEASVRSRVRDVVEWLRGHACSRFDAAAPALRPASGGRIRNAPDEQCDTIRTAPQPCA